MTRDKAVKYGILLNRILIVLALVVWAGSIFIVELLEVHSFKIILSILYPITAIVTLIFTIIVFIQLYKYNIKGAALLLASAIVAVIFSLYGVVIGLVTFILSGISLRQMMESQQDEEFRAELTNEQ